MITLEEGGLYYVRSRTPDDDRWMSRELAQFRAGEFLFFGTDDNADPDAVWIVTKLKVVEA
jgi:hypothetical protein